MHKPHGARLVLDVPLRRLLGEDGVDHAMRGARLEDGLAALLAGGRGQVLAHCAPGYRAPPGGLSGTRSIARDPSPVAGY
jgi:hypothetical protein